MKMPEPFRPKDVARFFDASEAAVSTFTLATATDLPKGCVAMSAEINFLDQALVRVRNGQPFTRDEIVRLNAEPGVLADLDPSPRAPDGRLYVKAIHFEGGRGVSIEVPSEG